MTIRFSCSCGKVVIASDEHAGTHGRCPKCGNDLVIPCPAAPPVA